MLRYRGFPCLVFGIGCYLIRIVQKHRYAALTPINRYNDRKLRGTQDMRTCSLFVALLAALPVGFAQENLRPDVPVAIVGGMLLDGYEAEPIHHSVVVFEDGGVWYSESAAYGVVTEIGHAF